MKLESKFLLVSILAVLTVTSIAAAAAAPTSVPFFSLANHSVIPTIQSTTTASSSKTTASLFSSSSSLPSFLSNIVQTAKADVDIDTSGNGKAAAFDGKNSISSDGKGFCNTVDNIAGGRFSSLFKGIVDCKSSDNKQQQYTVDYSVIKDPVKVGDTTYMSVSVRDRNTDQPVSDAAVLLTIESPSQSNSDPSVGGQTSTTTSSTSTTQTAYTDKDGHAIFTIHIGPHSNIGIYNTNLEVKKDTYDSKVQKSFQVV